MAIISNETFLQEVQKWVDAISDTLLNRLWSLTQDVRKKAFLIIEKKFQNNPNILTSAPISFLKKQDIDAAISLVIASLEHKKEVSFEVLEQVYESTLDNLESAQIDNNTEAIEVIWAKLELLTFLLENDEKYMQDEKILNFLYDEKMRWERYDEALKIAQKLIEKNNPEWYILLWLAYKYNDEPQKAILAFHAGWNQFQTQIYIENLVISAYEIGNLELSEKWYKLWVQLFPESMWYFIEYTCTIKSWEDFEILTQQILPKVSSNITKKLLESWINFLHKELIKEQENFLNSKDVDIKLALSSLFESLKIWHYLLEYSQDVQALLYHVFQFKELLKSDQEELKEVIKQFLDWFYSIDLSHFADEEDEEQDKTVENQEQESHIKLSLEENLYMYIQNCTKTFISYENQWALISWVFPFLKEIQSKIPKMQQMILDENYLDYLQEYMSREEDFVASLSVDMREVYKVLIADIDEKYGKTARRNIEFFTKNWNQVQEFENSELVSFQMIKTFIHQKLVSWLYPDKVQEIFEKSNIFSLEIDKDIFLLLWEVLFKSGCTKLAHQVFAHIHIKFQDDMSLYNLLKTWYMLGSKEASEDYKKILLAFDFEWNISEYVYEFIQNMKSYEDLDELNKKYLLLLEWVSWILYPKSQENIENIMNIFNSVGNMQDPEWIWWLGKIYEAHNEFESALWCYYEAFISQDIKNPIYLKECFKISFHLWSKPAITQIIQDSWKYFSHRGFEWEYFWYNFEHGDISYALRYFINTITKKWFLTSFPDSLDVKIKFIANKKDSFTLEEFHKTLSAQVLEMIRSDFSIITQISFLQTLSTIPDDFFEFLAWEMLELISDWKAEITSPEILLLAVENFAQNIIQKEINESMLSMIRDFYYLVAKVFEKIPGGQEYARKYMKKMDIPYLKWDFIVLSNELSSWLYH